MVQCQFHNPIEEVVPDEEEHGEFPPFQGETVTQFGEGSSSSWSADPSSWEDPRTSVYAPEASYVPFSLFHCIIRFIMFALIFSKFLPVLLCSFNFQNNKKISLVFCFR